MSFQERVEIVVDQAVLDNPVPEGNRVDFPFFGLIDGEVMIGFDPILTR